MDADRAFDSQNAALLDSYSKRAVQIKSECDPSQRIRQLISQSETAVEASIPIRRYLRSGVELQRMAIVYADEGNMEYAFVLLTRFISLLVEKISKHPDYKTIQPEDRAEKEQILKKEIPKALTAAEKLKKNLLEKYKQELDAILAREEENFKEECARAERELAKRPKPADVPASTPQPNGHEATSLRTPASVSAASGSNSSGMPSAPLPDWPAWDQTTPVSDEHSSNRSAQDAPTVPSRLLKPGHLLSQSATNQGHVDMIAGMRPVNVPQCIFARFLSLAAEATARNIETCGILCGCLVHGAFNITHLVIPKQTGTPDSCSTLNEEEIFTYQDKHNLITLGWIHTHPTQTAFLSSVDLHTHYGYQIMMPEAIAIVCSPKYQTNGIFSLTGDVGLRSIGSCTQHGFHPHANDHQLFQECKHTFVDADRSLTVADFRKQ